MVMGFGSVCVWGSRLVWREVGSLLVIYLENAGVRRGVNACVGGEIFKFIFFCCVFYDFLRICGGV